MLILTVQLQARRGQEQALKDELRQALIWGQREAGCLTYQVHQSLEQPGRFLLYERWESQAALDRHTQQPYVVEQMKRLSTILQQPGQPTTYRDLD